MTHFDDEPGSGEKREQSEGRENRGGMAGQGKHRHGEAPSNEGGGSKPKKEKGPDTQKPQKGSRPADPDK